MPQIDPSPGIVLHVEDDPAVAASLAMLLRIAGFRAITAVDGESAVKLVTDSGIRPDVLVVDFNLPGDMDGSETAEAICRALGESLPTILLSGELPNAGLPWLPGAPIWPIAKPGRPELIVKAVELFVDLHRWSATHTLPPRLPRCA